LAEVVYTISITRKVHVRRTKTNWTTFSSQISVKWGITQEATLWYSGKGRNKMFESYFRYGGGEGEEEVLNS
jgi:hypothetical protein